MAKAMATGGYKDVGYEYINIDDCWMTRLKNGTLAADPERFPHGIKYIADIVRNLYVIYINLFVFDSIVTCTYIY